MSVLSGLRLLLLGETWIIPGGILVLLCAGAAFRSLAPGLWHDFGGLILVTGVLAVLVASVHHRNAGAPN